MNNSLRTPKLYLSYKTDYFNNPLYMNSYCQQDDLLIHRVLGLSAHDTEACTAAKLALCNTAFEEGKPSNQVGLI